MVPLDAQRRGVSTFRQWRDPERRDLRLCRSSRWLPKVIGVPPDAGASAWLSTRKEGGPMGAKTEEVKGQVKEVVGTLAGDKNLESEGKADRRVGEAKEKLDDVTKKVDDFVDETSSKLDEVIDKTKEALHQN